MGGENSQAICRICFFVLIGLFAAGSAACLSPSGGDEQASVGSGDGGGGDVSAPEEDPEVPEVPESPDEGFGSSASSSSSASSGSDGSGDACTQLTPGVPVGLACIHCLHPNARPQTAAFTRILRESCRESIVVNILYDGRFGNDDDFLVSFFTSLSENRKLTVLLYLSNGPSQRLRDAFEPGVFGSGQSVDSFRNGIVNDEGFREAYRQVVQRVMGIRGRVGTNVTFILVPGLEDNLPDPVFENMLALTREVAGDAVAYGRSACPGCREGNGNGVPPGVLREVHTASPSQVVSDGIVTNDLSPYRFSFQSGGGLSLQDLAGVKNLSLERNTIFILWTAPYQGLPVEDNRVIGRPDPDVRNYAVPTDQEAAELVEFLR